MRYQPRGSTAIPTIAAVLGAIAITVVIVTLVRDISLPEQGVLVNRNTNIVINANGVHACPALAKTCPDGSYVTASGPNCEFAPCPGTNRNANFTLNSNTSTNINTSDPTAGWKTYTDSTDGFFFQYPNTLTSTYSDGKQIIGSTTQTYMMTVRVVDVTFDPRHLVSYPDPSVHDVAAAPASNPTEVTIGDRIGYKWLEGDAGCGGWALQTNVGSSKTLLLCFHTAQSVGVKNDWVTNPDALATLLSTFRFTE